MPLYRRGSKAPGIVHAPTIWRQLFKGLYRLSWHCACCEALFRYIIGVISSPSVLRHVTAAAQQQQRLVAFFAGLRFNIEEMPPNERAIMNETVTNVGDAYDPERGEFCAPVDGVYSFTVAISAQGSKEVMLINDKWDTCFRSWSCFVNFIYFQM